MNRFISPKIPNNVKTGFSEENNAINLLTGGSLCIPDKIYGSDKIEELPVRFTKELSTRKNKLLKELGSKNIALFIYTHDRMISYWNGHYRNQFT